MRSRWLAFGGLLVGGLLAVVATAQTWWRVDGDGVHVVFTGTEATGGLSQALAVVSLAGTLLVLVLRVRGRQVMAVLLGLVGLGVAVVGGLRVPPNADAIRTKLRQLSLVDTYTVDPTIWAWIFAVAGVLVLGGAVALLFGASGWPLPSDRFQRTTTAPVASLAEDPAGVWKALDAGVDPTLEHEGHDKVTEIDPDVHNEATGDTMGTKQESSQSSESRE